MIRKTLFWSLMTLFSLPVLHAQVKAEVAYVNGNARYGLKDLSTNKWIIPPRFDYTSGGRNGLYYFQQDGKWGVYDRTGKLVVPFLYSDVKWLADYDFMVLKKDGYWGVISNDNVPVLPFIYEEIRTGDRWQAKRWDDEAGRVVIDSYERAKIKAIYSENKRKAQQPVTVQNTAPAQSAQQRTPAPQASQRAMLEILSPADNSSVQSGELTVRYRASEGRVGVRIGDRPLTTGVTRGVERDFREMTVRFDPVPGANTLVFELFDEQGNPLEQIRRTLHYAGERRKPDMHILAVGIGSYQDKSLMLTYPPKDAREVASQLARMGPSTYGKVHTPVVLTDKEADRRRILSELGKLSRAVQTDDIIFIYLSGHGDEDSGNYYFLPCDTDKDELPGTAVDFDVINKEIRKLTDLHCKVILIVDACYAGALYDTRSLPSFTEAPPGVVGYYAATKSQKAFEGEDWGNGLFTRKLLEGLKGAAADEKGEITLKGLDKYVGEKVQEASKNKQKPIMKNNLGEFVLFTPGKK